MPAVKLFGGSDIFALTKSLYFQKDAMGKNQDATVATYTDDHRILKKLNQGHNHGLQEKTKFINVKKSKTIVTGVVNKVD